VVAGSLNSEQEQEQGMERSCHEIEFGAALSQVDKHRERAKRIIDDEGNEACQVRRMCFESVRNFFEPDNGSTNKGMERSCHEIELGAALSEVDNHRERAMRIIDDEGNEVCQLRRMCFESVREIKEAVDAALLLLNEHGGDECSIEREALELHAAKMISLVHLHEYKRDSSCNVIWEMEERRVAIMNSYADYLSSHAVKK